MVACIFENPSADADVSQRERVGFPSSFDLGLNLIQAAQAAGGMQVPDERRRNWD